MNNLSKFAIVATTCGTLLPASAAIIAAPNGSVSLGTAGDIQTGANLRLSTTEFYTRNSSALENVGGVIQVTTGTNTFDAVSIGFDSAGTPASGTANQFAALAGQLFSFTFDYRPVNDADGVPTFNLRLNTGANSNGQRVNLTVGTIDLGGGITRYSLSDFAIPTLTDLTPVDRLSLYVSFGNAQNFSRSTANVGEISGATLTVVPEPSSIALLGLGACGLLVRRRR